LILARGRYLTRDLLRRTFRHLKDHFGPPHYFYADYYGGLPLVWWQFDTLKVSVGPEYGNDRISIVVSHEPSDFEDLRQQAAQWETEHGVGAREDYKEGAVVI
jgi:O-methyltransferase involved in polyketide biosynthesis